MAYGRRYKRPKRVDFGLTSCLYSAVESRPVGQKMVSEVDCRPENGLRSGLARAAAETCLGQVGSRSQICECPTGHEPRRAVEWQKDVQNSKKTAFWPVRWSRLQQVCRTLTILSPQPKRPTLVIDASTPWRTPAIQKTKKGRFRPHIVPVQCRGK